MPLSSPKTDIERPHAPGDTSSLTAIGATPRGPSWRIGPYEIKEVIGHGMGVVYHAIQLSPAKRAVALKVIRAEMSGATVLARFEVERQALAMMDHPGVAELFDAGTTETGLPFIAIELVDGREEVTS